MNSKKLSIASGLALSLALTACQSPGNNNEAQLAELTAKVAAMDKKLDRIAASQARATPPPPKRPTVGQLYKVDVGRDDAYRGGRNAKVTLVVASEFACPYCKLLAGATNSLLEHYQDEDLKIVSKHFVVHPSIATRPALAACAANKQGHFEEYEQALWAAAWEGDTRPQLRREGLADGSLDAIANRLGLDMSQFHNDMEGSCKQVVARNQADMSKLGVGGTPAVYINGTYYGGPRTVEGLKAAIDSELTKANTVLANGARLETYYEGLIEKGKPSV